MDQVEKELQAGWLAGPRAWDGKTWKGRVCLLKDAWTIMPEKGG